MVSKIRLSWLVVSLGVAMVMAFLLSESAGAWEGTLTSQPQSSSTSPQQAVSSSAGKSVMLEQPPLCRYGVVAGGAAQLSWLPTWRAGWTLDFGSHAPVPGVVAELVQVIGVKQNKNGCTYLDGYTISPALTEEGLGAVIRAAPGSLWIVGNEPDRGPSPGGCQIGAQGDTYPEVYARAYHDTYSFIKQRDPAARVAIAGLVEVTPGRLQYLDKVWAEYTRRYGRPMPVDVWNMHLYILPEAEPNGQPNGIASIAVGTDPGLAIRGSGGDPKRCGDALVYCYADHDKVEIFEQQVRAMRNWMKNHGQQNRPLILSEYSLLYPYDIDPEGCFVQDEYGNCFTPQRVSTFMKNSFNYLEGPKAVDPALGYPLDGNRLVQRWMWFSANYSGAGRASNLLENTLLKQTLVGETFQSEAANRVSSVNLFPGQVTGSAGRVSGPGQTATAALSVEVLNNGSVANTTPMQVRFYADSALTQEIGTVTVNEPITGCAARSYRVYTTWADLSLGVHPFWVQVDYANSVIETDEADNVGAGVVYVYAHGLYLPMMSR
jgi:hypothetical protein